MALKKRKPADKSGEEKLHIFPHKSWYYLGVTERRVF